MGTIFISTSKRTMFESVHVEGFDAFMFEVGKHAGKPVFVLFSGSKDKDGVSWCPDCVTADPVIEEHIKIVEYDFVFIHCGVGERAYWKDQSNIFRTHQKLRLKSVPTLIKWGTSMRLEEMQCANTQM